MIKVTLYTPEEFEAKWPSKKFPMGVEVFKNKRNYGWFGGPVEALDGWQINYVGHIKNTKDVDKLIAALKTGSVIRGQVFKMRSAHD